MSTYSLNNVNYSYTVGSGIASVASSSAIISGSVDILAKFTVSNMEYTVTSIGNFAFHVKQNITNVTIPNTITSIGIHVFELCTSLTSITIPSSVTTIGNNAFSNCFGLLTIVLNSNLANFKQAFVNINNANLNVTLNYVGAILDGMFYNFDKLTTITIGPNITSIGEEAFNTCSSLKSITIPSSVTTIGASAFRNCSSLTSIIIPSSVTSVGNYAFYFTGLTNIIVNTYLANFSTVFWEVNNPNLKITFNYVAAIPDGACSNKTNITSVTIGSGITSIGANAFQSCSRLTSITIPSSVTSIGDYAFSGTGLKNIICNAYLVRFGSAFFGLNNVGLQITFNYVGAIPDGACNGRSNLKSVTIGSGITSIGANAFNGCSSLNNVYFLGNIPTIANGNFLATGDTAYYITGATNITRLTMFTNNTSLSLSQMYTLLGYIQSSPVITTIDTSNRTVSINFTQLTNLEIPTITNYAYSTDGIVYTDLTPAQITSPLQITGLTNGQTYSFIIKAYNGVYSNSSNSVSVIVSPPPSAPIITSVSYSIPNSVKVNFTQINNSGAPVTGYKYSLDGGQTYTAINGVTTSPLTISGLKTGLINSIVLKSNNGEDSVASNAVNFTHYLSMSKSIQKS